METIINILSLKTQCANDDLFDNHENLKYFFSE